MNLAEKQIISNQLQNAVVGKTITRAIVNQNPHTFVWFALKPSQMFCAHDANNTVALGYESLLNGQIIEKAEVIGGRLYLFISNRALSIDFTPQYFTKNTKPPKRHQLLLMLNDESYLSFTSSLGGALFFIKIGENGWATEGGFPSILTDEFSQDFFLNLIKQTELRSLSAKAFLATKNRIPGLDNTILHEILWEAKVNPKSKMKILNESDFINMYNAIKKVFPAVIQSGGLDTQKDLFGYFGGYITQVSKKTLGKPCFRCGCLIEKEAYLGGVVYYCPECQPFIKS
ncbi:hypothetical protein [Anaerosporobacter sp.]|uniref:hypothetical protein n=1 Tax=Anaerosporobacter sp. TaxID=1872529 RepID=UPI00286F4286|nr:hypothetical protein [Anaerosporobacter sp.]